MGYLEIDKLAECLWIMHHGVEDMYAWAEMNGLPRDSFLIQSGSISVEQTGDGVMLYLVAVPLNEEGAPFFRGNEIVMQSMVLPYVEPIPEGIGKLIDWDYGVPSRTTSSPEHAEEDEWLN